MYIYIYIYFFFQKGTHLAMFQTPIACQNMTNQRGRIRTTSHDMKPCILENYLKAY